MNDRRPADREPVRPWLIAAIAVGSAAAGLTAGLAAVTAKFSRSVVIPSDSSEEELRIHGVDPEASTITLAVSTDSLMPGRYSLWFANGTGHARVGDIVAVENGQVRRTLETVDYGSLADARYCRLGSWYYLDPREFGLAVDDVTIETEVGPAPPG